MNKFLICILNESPQYLFEELNSLIINILFLFFSNILENKSKEEKENNDKNNNGDYDLKKNETKLEENTNSQKWLIKIFISNKKSI